MANIEESNKSGRQTSVDVNIVPFIDLMSVLVIFLLITAVWSQVSIIQLGSSIYGKKNTDESSPPPPRAEVPFRIDVRSDGHKVVIGQQEIFIAKRGAEYNTPRLLEELKKIKSFYPDKLDAVITMKDEIEYGFLITAMDMALQAGFPQVSVSTVGAD